MKNIVFTLRFIPLVMLVTLSWSVSGQTIIKEISSVPSQQSIIRNYTDSVDIVYCDSKDSACFMYVDHATNSVKCTRLPDDVKVNDFEIDQRELYFCGNKQGYGFVGMFNITDFFFGTGNMQYYHMNSGISTNQSIDYITNLKRLDFTYYDTAVHLLMIGEGYHSESGKTTHDCIMDMWFYTSNALAFEYTIEDTGYLSYDDVAVTDHYIVVSAHSIAAYDPLAHFLLPYTKPTISVNSIFTSYLPSPPNNNVTISANMTDYAVLGAYNGNDIQIVSMGGDSVATVCDGIVFGNYRHSVIGLYDDPMNMPFLRLKFNLHQDTNYLNIAFNRRDRRLYMIPNLTDNIYYTEPPYTTVTDILYPKTKWLSITRNQTNQTMSVSGYNTVDNSTSIMQFDPQNSSACVDRVTELLDTLPEYWGYPIIHQIINRTRVSLNNTIFNSKKESLIIICK